METIRRIKILIETIAAPLGIIKEYAIHKPKRIDNSEKTIEIIKVDLKLHPKRIAAATGIIIIEEIRSTPTDSNNTETTIDKTTININ